MTKLPPLNEKNLERQKLAFIFGFVTPRYLMRIFNWSYEAVWGSLSPATRNGWLRQIPIGGGFTGFQPTLAAARELGGSPSLVRPLGGPQSILPRFMVETDCGNRRVRPLALHSVPLAELRAGDYRLIPGESHPVTFAYPVVATNPVRLCHRVKEHYRHCETVPWLAELIRKQEFAIRILAPSIGCAKRTSEVFRTRGISRPVEIDVIPEAQAWVG